MRAKLLSIALILPILHIAPAAAQVTDLADLVGARAAGGQTQLEARGYAHVTTNTVRDTKWSFWWNERMRACVQVATTDGRYAAIQRVPDGNCRQVATTLPSGLVRPTQLPSRPDYDTSPNNDPRPDYDARPGNGDRFGPSITLVCFGGGSGPAMQYRSGYVYNSRSHRFEPQSGAVLGRDGFASDVQIEIWHGRGRIHLEGKLVSPIHSGGDNGWWNIDNLVITPDRITGQYRMNGMNKPRFEIDRRSRRITIRAATNFTGGCDAGDWRGGGGF